jgi:hypothetical protein
LGENKIGEAFNLNRLFLIGEGLFLICKTVWQNVKLIIVGLSQKI